MSKRWSLNWWNDWRYVRRGVFDVTLLRVNADYLKHHYACVDVVVLGFGASLTRYSAREPFSGWSEIAGAAASMYGAAPVESLGREHADGAA